ncbi:hypothetical protein BACCOPRO_01898 [Phocaeicola coprophilus DSM 18228 = JCM 13818]|uniref:Uncharacterized protein n=1 Tax=Phocaeicola coprophilus DSM 18228 = JCM 13818 TaxID=547042 RepID=S0F7L1_9BACT|nr:hypothetical protein BACCOPRO_01898 [Phocaeicola coprophilus DSM 18228 = JCM 13818]
MLSDKKVVLLEGNLKVHTMGKNNKNSKRQRYSKREEEKANRLFKGICIGLILLALLIFAGYVLA